MWRVCGGTGISALFGSNAHHLDHGGELQEAGGVCALGDELLGGEKEEDDAAVAGRDEHRRLVHARRCISTVVHLERGVGGRAMHACHAWMP